MIHFGVFLVVLVIGVVVVVFGGGSLAPEGFFHNGSGGEMPTDVKEQGLRVSKSPFARARPALECVYVRAFVLQTSQTLQNSPFLPLIAQRSAVLEDVRGKSDGDAVGLDGMHEVIAQSRKRPRLRDPFVDERV